MLEAEDGKVGASSRPATGVDLAILDYRLPDLDGLSVLKQIRQIDPDVLVILLTAYASVDTAVEAMKLGAYHFMNKPFDLEALAAMVEQALETTRLRREVRQLRANAGRAVQPRAHGRRVAAAARVQGARSSASPRARRRRCC